MGCRILITSRQCNESQKRFTKLDIPPHNAPELHSCGCSVGPQRTPISHADLSVLCRGCARENPSPFESVPASGQSSGRGPRRWSAGFSLFREPQTKALTSTAVGFSDI